ncbi:MAG: hypothetical protein PVH85_20050 [Desulfobacterales bacterium]|jgi:hypothetical protein
MIAQKRNQETDSRDKIPLIACFVLFALYLINLILGKINISYGLNLPHLGNVAEFLLLFGACILLIIAALKRETAEKTI